jgi:hypothetical protein
VEVEAEVEVSSTLGASACSRFPTPLPMQRIARGRAATRAICTERLMLIRWRVRPFHRQPALHAQRLLRVRQTEYHPVERSLKSM